MIETYLSMKKARTQILNNQEGVMNKISYMHHPGAECIKYLITLKLLKLSTVSLSAFPMNGFMFDAYSVNKYKTIIKDFYNV
jgi:hypothetical protein